jgi:hypothetical protein
MFRWTWIVAVLVLCSCSKLHRDSTHQIKGLLLVTGAAYNGIAAWDERGMPIFLIADSDNALDQVDRLYGSPSVPDCRKMYESTFTVGLPKNGHDLFGGTEKVWALISISEAHLTSRPEAQLRTLLHQRDLSAGGICRSDGGGRRAVMSDTYETASRLENHECPRFIGPGQVRWVHCD